MGKRAVSPVVGMVVLVGLVTIVGLSVVVVGLTVVDGAQSTAETQQAETSMAEFASTADDIATSRSQSGSFSFVGDEDGTTWVNESAGHMELVVVNGSNRETISVGNLGVYRHRTSDGTEIAYQSGGVWRLDDGDPVLIKPPNLEYRGEGNTSTLQFPVISVTGEDVAGGSVEGGISVVDRSSSLAGANVTNPVTGDALKIKIDSRYCAGWEEYANTSTPATMEESCDSGTPQRLVLNHSLPDAAASSGDTIDGGSDWWGEEAVRTSSDFDVRTGVNGEIAGNVSYGGSFNKPIWFDVNNATPITPEAETHDDEIQNRIDGGTNWRDLCEPDCSYDAGTYYINNDNLGIGEDEDIDIDVSSGDVTLVLNTSLTLQTGQSLIVTGHESTDNVVRIYTNHDVTFNNDGTVGPAGAASFADPSDSYDADAEVLQIYGGSNTDLILKDSVNFEGVFDAPAGNNGTSTVTDQAGGLDISVAGAIRTGHFSLSNGLDYEHMYDDTLGDSGGGGRGDSGGGNSTTGQFYLHMSETEIAVDS